MVHLVLLRQKILIKIEFDLLRLFDLLVSSYLSLAPTDAVVGTTHPVAAGLWYLAMGLAEVEAASLVA